MSDTGVDAVLSRFADQRCKVSPRHQATYWSQGANTRLGAQYKTQIAYHLVKLMHVGTLKSLAGRAFALHQAMRDRDVDMPAPTRGPVRGSKRALAVAVDERPADIRLLNETRDYSEQNYRDWISAKASPAPKGEGLRTLTSCVLRAADELLAHHFRDSLTLEQLLNPNFKGTAAAALEQGLSLLNDPPGDGDWSHIESKRHGIVPSGRPLAWSDELKAHYGHAVEMLRLNSSVEVFGPHYSGKHSLLRRVYDDYHVGGFLTAGGARIPIFAASLHELPAAEVIGRLASFYREALHLPPGVNGLPGWLDEISHFSRRLPVLIILAGLDVIDGDEVVRALNQDLLGEIVTRIMAGHPHTRLLASRLTDAPLRRSQRRRSTGIPALDRQAMQFHEQIPLESREKQPLRYEFDALRLAMASLATGSRPLSRDAQLLGERWRDGSGDHLKELTAAHVDQLADHIASALLEPDEVSCLALIALAQDRPTLTRVRAIVSALGRACGDDGDWRFDPSAILERMPREIVSRSSSGDEGAEGRFSVERAFRDRLLNFWSRQHPAKFRMACWGLARATASEAADLRVRSGVHVATARDVQTLVYLLASADVASVTGSLDGNRLEEARILPPLGTGHAALPAAADIISFAYYVLFERDLALIRNDDGVFGDARLRLAAARAFVNAGRPWRFAPIADDPRGWALDADDTPWSKLPGLARIRLLSFATDAAARINLPHLVAEFGEAARRLHLGSPWTTETFIDVADIRRSALDAGILFGCDPARTGPDGGSGDGPPAITLRGVERMAVALIEEAPDGLSATRAGRRALAKLRARRAEILHMSGSHLRALLAFEDAGLFVVRGSDQTFEHYREPLTGRSRRMYLRLLVELARAEFFDRRSAPVLYGDGLRLPTLRRPLEKSGWLDKAKQIARESVRDLTSGSMNDWIGAKIDSARISAVQVRYAEALETLTQARSSIRGPGVGRDMILELLSVHARTLADAASFAMSAVRPPKGHVIDQSQVDEVTLLGKLMRVTGTSPTRTFGVFASKVSLSLCNEATDCLEILKSLTVLPDRTGTRYVIFANYLEVWLDVVLSRQWVSHRVPEDVRRDGVRTRLLEAARKLKPVVWTMKRSGYLMHWREVRLLAAALDAAGAPVELPPRFPLGRVGNGTPRILLRRERLIMA